MIRLPLAAALAAILVAAPVAALAGPGDGAPIAKGHGAARGGHRHGGPGARMRERMQDRHRRMARLMRMLELSDAQRQIVAEGSALAAPVRQDLRAKITAIFEDAKTSPRTKETREAVRAKVKEAVQAALGSLEAPARRLLDSLTPDQKGKFEAKAKEHGKAFDEQKLLKAFEGMLLAPRHGAAGQGGHRHRGGR